MSRTRTILFWILVFAGVFFIASGCVGLYEIMGYSRPEAERLAGLDREAAEPVITEARDLVWQTVSVVIAGVGSLISGLLGKWLIGERKLTAAVITGVEKDNGGDVKAAIMKVATAMGVEPALHKRVMKLT